MSKYVTIVFRMPEDSEIRKTMQAALDVLKPHQTAMSLEDEMTILELIENHPDFADYIADDAREQAAKLHQKAVETETPIGF